MNTCRRGSSSTFSGAHFTQDHAHAQLDIAIDWGRYAELFDYDANTGRLSLDPDT